MFNLQPVEDLPAFRRVALDQLCQRAHLCAQRIGLALGLGPLCTGIGFARLRVGAGFFRGQKGRIRRG